jgi:hypothetical protein
VRSLLTAELALPDLDIRDSLVITNVHIYLLC